MPVDPLSKLRHLSADELKPILAQLLGAGASPVDGWTVTEIGRSVGAATAGIYRIAGNAQTAVGDQPWSAVVKVLGPPKTPGREFDAVVAQRELEVYRSGLLASPHYRVRPPLCYGIDTWDNLHFIWLEDLSAAPQPPWRPEHFLHTARHIGQFNGYWSGPALPSWTWLSPDSLRAKYRSPRHADVFSRLALLQADPIGRRALPADVFADLLQLWSESDDLLGRVEATPKCLCHRDCHVKNLFPMPDAGDGPYTIAIDWDLAGIEHLGADAGLLLASTTKWLELPVEQAIALVDPIFEAYLTGLKDVGWAGNAMEVQLTYLTCLGMGEAMRTAQLIAIAVEMPESHATFQRLMGKPVEEVFDLWVDVLRFFLTQKDRARQLARQL